MNRFSVIFVLFLFSCASQPKLLLKPEIKIETLGIEMQINPAIPQAVHAELNKQLDDFIARHNSTPHRFKVARAIGGQLSSLLIRVHDLKFVSQDKQTAGVFISMIGLSLPFIMAAAEAPFIFAFWYFPKVASMSELRLSDDIGDMKNQVIQKHLTSPGFLLNPARQLTRHGVTFSRYLASCMSGLEKTLKR